MKRCRDNRYQLAFPVLLLFVSGLFGQLKSDLSQTIDQPRLKSVAGSSWLDPYRFTMNQGFSVSLMAGNGWPGGATSLSVYTNQMRYLVTDNLLLSSQIHVVQPGSAGAMLPGGNQLQLYYQASMDWQLARNMNIHLGISTLPTYGRYAPRYRSGYAPLQMYQLPDHSETVDQ